MKRVIIILVLADIVLTAIFLPWGMLINAGFMILAFLIIFPMVYYRLFIKPKKDIHNT